VHCCQASYFFFLALAFLADFFELFAPPFFFAATLFTSDHRFCIMRSHEKVHKKILIHFGSFISFDFVRGKLQ
jgi:hypothetical protein